MNLIRQARLSHEFERLLRLHDKSSLFDIVATKGEPPERYLLSFNLKSLVRNEAGKVLVYDAAHILEVYCPCGYPGDGPRILYLQPQEIFHPNILWPLICLNRWVPSMFLDEIALRIASVISYRTFTMDEKESLNKDACAWARSHQERFPIDRRSIIDDGHSKIEVW